MEHDTRFSERRSDSPTSTRNRLSHKSRLGGDRRTEGPSRSTTDKPMAARPAAAGR
jgi:hypothetical protein